MRRSIGLSIALSMLTLGLLPFVGAAGIIWDRSRVDEALASDAKLSMLGPKSDALREHALGLIKHALDRLDQGDSRLAAYVDDLHRSESYLRAAIRASAVDGRALQAIAVVRLELETIKGSPVTSEYARLIEVARERRRGDGAFQVDVADTYLRMGDTAQALAILGETVAVNGALGRKAVALLDQSGVAPMLIAASLGNSPEVLLALETPFLRHGMLDAYLNELDRVWPTTSAELIERYGDLCELYAKWPPFELLSKRLDAVDPAALAAQLSVLARAQFAAGNSLSAESYARRAVDVAPRNSRYRELLADCLARGDRNTEALQALNQALTSAIAGVTSAGQRGRLYRKMGEAYERLGEGDKAYDAYHHALDLTPEDPLVQDLLTTISHAPPVLGDKTRE